jgi:hypothetical protein
VSGLPRVLSGVGVASFLVFLVWHARTAQVAGDEDAHFNAHGKHCDLVQLNLLRIKRENPIKYIYRGAIGILQGR